MDSHGRRSGSPALVVDAGRELVSHLSARSCFTKEARIGKLERSTDSIIGTTFHLGAYISRQSTPWAAISHPSFSSNRRTTTASLLSNDIKISKFTSPRHGAALPAR